MASGYIGKISAVVTANTSDLTKKLADAGNDTKRFSENLNRSISSAANSAQNSLQKIFTPLQNIERRLQTSLKIPGLDLPLDQIRAAVSLTEQINKPLAKVVSGFNGLSLEVQGAFLPALQRAQDQAVRLNLQLANTGKVSETSFAQAQRAIEDYTAAQNRLAQAESIAQRGLTGRELQFRDPGVFNALTRTASLTQKAGNLPESVLADGTVGGTVERLTQLSEQIQLQFARLENLRLSPQVDATQVQAAESSLESLVAEAKQAQRELEKLVTLDEKVKALGYKDGNPIGKPGKKVEYGPPSTITRFDGSGRSIQERLADIQAEETRRLQQASGKLNILSGFDAEVARTRANMREIRQEALKLGEAFDSVSNQRFFDASIFRKQQGELSALRDTIGRVGADVRGPLEAAFSSYAATVSNALDRGERGFEENTQEIQRQRAELIKLIAATGQVGNVGNITAGVNRAGDVGRAGFDKFSLALNQAAFAVDDFLSSTGGLEFKLRAVQNNVTQLAFILGNTKGLFIGLAAVIGTQLVIGLLKANGLLDEERDILDSLNDAFREQEQRVAALADAYDSLGESIRDAGLDEAGRTQAGRQRQLDEIRKAEEEARVARAAAVDPEVNRLRIERSRLQRENEQSTSGAVRATNEIEIGRINQEIERRSRELSARQSTPATVRQALESVGLAEIERQVAEFTRRGVLDPREIEQFRERRQRELRQQVAGIDLSNADAELAALDQARQEVRARMDENSGLPGFFRDGSGENYNALNAQLETLTAEYAALEARIRDAAPGAAFVRFTEALYGVADTLDRARANIDTAGLGRSLTGDALTAVNESLNRRREQAAQARAEGNTELLDALTADIAGLEAYALELESAANATQLFAETLRRVSGDLNETVAKEAQGRADAARREANAAAALPPELRTPGQRAAQFERDAAEREARRAEQQRQEVERQNLQAVQQFNERAMAGEYGADIQALVQEREQLQRDIESGRLSAEQEQQARQRRAEIDSQLNRRFEDTPEGRAARQRADEADTAAARARQQAESRARGRDLLEDPAARAARGVVQSLADIDAAFQAQRENQAGFVTPRQQQQFDEARARVLDEARRSAAPALFALQDAVANAVLQGPSRQALNAADITTQQGTAELNRLLRGDDSARDQNLLELQKQTAELEKLNANLGAAGVAD